MQYIIENVFRLKIVKFNTKLKEYNFGNMRPEAASPAVGSANVSGLQEAELIEGAFRE